MCSKVARAGGFESGGGREEGGEGARGGGGGRKKGNSEGGWLMRIESWGRFSVYVARIRNFGAPNHIQYLRVRLNTPPRARASARIDKSGASPGEKMATYFRFAIP